MKYMILTFASQAHYDQMVGKPASQPAWGQEDWAALGAFYAPVQQGAGGFG